MKFYCKIILLVSARLHECLEIFQEPNPHKLLGAQLHYAVMVTNFSWE